jgi:hypothetical protein
MSVQFPPVAGLPARALLAQAQPSSGPPVDGSGPPQGRGVLPADAGGRSLAVLGAAVLETASSIANLPPQGNVAEYLAAAAGVQALAMRIAKSDAGLDERRQWADELTAAIQGQIDRQTSVPPGPNGPERLAALRLMLDVAQASGEPPQPQALPPFWGGPSF